jgi:hypothetical protein
VRSHLFKTQPIQIVWIGAVIDLFPGETTGRKETIMQPGSIPRNIMPQIKSLRVPQFLTELVSEGIAVTGETVIAGSLRASQKELVEDNIVGLLAKPEKLGLPVMVSQDNWVLDGHHRWAANARLGNTQLVHRVHLPVVEALERMQQFSVRYEDCATKEGVV